MPHPPNQRRQWLASSLGLGLGLGMPLAGLRAAVAATDAASAASPASAASAAGTRWTVGPGESLTRVADALRLAGDGDTIAVQPGTYAGDVAVIAQRRLHIVGLGDGPVLLADGQHAEGKAIWVVRGGDITVENIAFQGCRVPSHNGAGIRFERGRLRLRRCRFHDNQMGLLSGNETEAVLEIDDCSFGAAPDNPGALPHLLYVGRIAHLQLQGSLLQQGQVGHLLKCRARSASIRNNRFDDGRLGRASYEVDLPNGGAVLLEDNTLVQSPLTENAVMLSYGAEGQAWPDSSLLLRGNTFVNHRPGGGSFVRVWADRLPPGAPVRSEHNRLLGPGNLVLGPHGQSVDDQRGPG